MKKFSVFSVMLVLLLAFGLAFSACGDDGGGNSDPKTLTITGLDGKTGFADVTLFTDEGVDFAGNSVNFSLQPSFTDVQLYAAGETIYWTGNGQFHIRLWVTQVLGGSGKMYMWTENRTFADLGITPPFSSFEDEYIPAIRKLPKKDFNSASTTIPFSEFTIAPGYWDR